MENNANNLEIKEILERMNTLNFKYSHEAYKYSEEYRILRDRLYKLQEGNRNA